MEKLVLEKDEEAIYKLEVNDKGEYIEFDLNDIGLGERILNASERLEKIDGEYQQKALKINEEEENKIERIKKQIKLDKQYALEMREIFDSFLGEGACQKIFGDKEVYGQYNRLMEALAPHFDKMQIDSVKAKKKLIEKYSLNEKDVI